MPENPKLTRYEVGFHGGEDFCHVSKINPDATDSSRAYANGDAVDLFDVALYDPAVMEGNGRSARDNSEAAVRELVALANEALAARELIEQGNLILTDDESNDAQKLGRLADVLGDLANLTKVTS